MQKHLDEIEEEIIEEVVVDSSVKNSKKSYKFLWLLLLIPLSIYFSEYFGPELSQEQATTLVQNHLGDTNSEIEFITYDGDNYIFKIIVGENSFIAHLSDDGKYFYPMVIFGQETLSGLNLDSSYIIENKPYWEYNFKQRLLNKYDFLDGSLPNTISLETTKYIIYPNLINLDSSIPVNILYEGDFNLSLNGKPLPGKFNLLNGEYEILADGYEGFGMKSFLLLH